MAKKPSLLIADVLKSHVGFGEIRFRELSVTGSRYVRYEWWLRRRIDAFSLCSSNSDFSLDFVSSVRQVDL